MAKDRTAFARTAHVAATRALRRFFRVPAPVREELAQEATLRTLEARAVLDPARFAARVAPRLAIDWLRKRAEQPLADAAEVAEPSPWEGRVEARADLARVAAALARAPRTHRETLVLLFVDGVTVEEAVEARLRLAPEVDRAHARDVLYKRRRRALGWIRDAVGVAA